MMNTESEVGRDPIVPLAPRTTEDTTGEVQRVLGKLDAGGWNKRILRIVANSETAFRPFVLLSTSLLSSRFLPRQVQEVVILYLANRRQVDYEWLEHVPMAMSAG